MRLTKKDRQELRRIALVALKTSLGRFYGLDAPQEWELQTSNSFRRIGNRGFGDGDVLSGVSHPVDGHPDLRAAPGVLDYIIAAQPSVVLELLDELDDLRDCEECGQLFRNNNAYQLHHCKGTL